MTPSQQVVEDALTHVASGPAKTADWMTTAAPMCRHCLPREDVDQACARILAAEVRRLRAEIAVVGQWSSVVIAGPPTENEHVLVYFEFGGLSGFSVAYWTHLRGWLQILGDRSDACDCDPTHWMSLPKEP